jgi:hypothetical protein
MGSCQRGLASAGKAGEGPTGAQAPISIPTMAIAKTIGKPMLRDMFFSPFSWWQRLEHSLKL